MFASLLAMPIQKRATIMENPAVDLTDPRAWEVLFGGTPSDSGISLTGHKVLEYSPVWQAVATISEDISVIPTFIYKRTADGGKERALRHPAYPLLRRKANPIHTAQLWKQVMVAQALIFGNSFSLINRDEFATPLELLVLDPHLTRAYVAKGRTAYRTRIAGQPKTFEASDIFHLRGVSIDALEGLSLIQFAKNSLGRGLAAEKFSAKYFANNAMPSGVLTHPHRLTDATLQHLRESTQQLHGGLDKQHRFAILEEGMTWTPIGVEPEKSQMLATMAFSVKDVARWFKIPPHRLGDDSRTAYNSVEQENLSYQESTLTPWFCKLREEAYDKLLTEREKRLESHTIEEQRLAILAADATTRANFYSRGLLDGWLNRDEVRSFENLNPIPDGEGQAFMAPLNMQLLGEESEPEDDPPADSDPDDDIQDDSEDENQDRGKALAQLEVLTDAAVRAAKRLAHYTERASKDPSSFCDWMENYAHEHREIIAAMFASAVRAAHQLGIDTPSAGDLADRLIEDWTGNVDQITREATADGLAGQVVQLGQRYPGGQAKQFARNQIQWNGELSIALSS